MSQTLIQVIASRVDARLNCEKAGNSPGERLNFDDLEKLEKLLPDGSGIDCGTKIDLGRSTDNKVVFTFSYHHMNDRGYYNGWTEHTLTIRPHLLLGLDLTLTGPDKNQIKNYLYDTYQYTLTRPCEWNDEKKRYYLQHED